MRKKATFLFRCSFICILLVFIQPSGWSQVSDPSSWNTFVTGSENTWIRDTFRLQTFNGWATDNWNYTTVGKTDRFDPSTVSPLLDDASDGMAIRLYAGSRIAFDDYPLSIYRDVRIHMAYAFVQVSKGMSLLLSSQKRESVNNIKNRVYMDPTQTISASFKEIKRENGWNTANLIVGADPWNASLSVGEPSSIGSGYYTLDSVFAHGEIPRYSLFTGTGLWEEEACWSHLPASRQREALVSEGDLTIDSEVHCRSIHLHKSQLRFSDSGTLALDSSLYVYYTFPGKGKWYFVSFPFDLYPEDMDPEFEWKDDAPNEGGNYFYLRRYDGWRRTEQQDASGNWTILSPSSHPSGQPLLEKNKGYLIALDAKASKETFCVEGKGERLSADFGRNSTILVTTAPQPSGSKEEHLGWQLCGNPFPSELRLSDIAPNPDLDGFVYLLEGSAYKAYPIGSSYAIPPYSAFFVKANRDTELRITMGEPTAMYKTIALSSLPEEATGRTEPAYVPLDKGGKLRCRIEGSRLYVENMPTAGKACIYDLSGRICREIEVPTGNSVHLVSLPKGFYSVGLLTGDDASGKRIPACGIQYVR